MQMASLAVKAMASLRFAPLALVLVLVVGVTGCSEVSNDKSTVKDVFDARQQSMELANDLLRIVDLQGDQKKPANAVGVCDGRSDEKFYRVSNSSSLWGPSAQELHGAMDRLLAELPKAGWEISEHGREKTEAKDRYLKANSKKAKFTAYIALLEPTRNSRRKKPLLQISLASACFEVPEGKSAKYEY